MTKHIDGDMPGAGTVTETLFRVTGPNFVCGVIFDYLPRRGPRVVRSAPLIRKIMRLSRNTRISDLFAICLRRGYVLERLKKDGGWGIEVLGNRERGSNDDH